jgi:DNA invertase Pin-like site-specific DNA recombinase
MNASYPQKVTAEHLKRAAYLYVRQSTLRQVFENTESTERQYALRQRAMALGWPSDRIVVIDNDLGQSGASAADREGFQKLVSEAGMGRAGIVLGLEVSRLARNCSDWHRLLEICAMRNTLILDEDGLYDPANFNDRLLLGLKGTMSEAELHMIHARCQGGLLNKAQRGELKMELPVGFVYDGQNHVVLDPDRQVQQALRVFFEAYDRAGTACGVVKYFQTQGLLFPCRLLRGANKGDLVWSKLGHSRTLQILHNPRYAGAFVYGRTCTKVPNCDSRHILPQEQWRVLIMGAHAGYITWQQYEENRRRLRACAQAYGGERRRGPPGEGPALLQGLAVCGRCGQRMTVRYHQRCGRLVPDYVCQREGIEQGKAKCQSIPGGGIDIALGRLLLECMTPTALEVSLAVFEELRERAETAERLRRQQVERARYEANLARSRYMQVDPHNRLVADTLEAEWNDRLRRLTEAEQDCEQQRRSDVDSLDEKARQRILGLAADIPRLWHDPGTSDEQRKRMVRLLIEDATLTKSSGVKVQIRFRGGATRELLLPIPPNAWQRRQTGRVVIEEIDGLLDSCTDGQTADELNRRGRCSGEGLPFTGRLVACLRREYHLKSHYERLREAGKFTREELSQALGVSPATIRERQRRGLVVAHPYNDKNECLYDPPADNSLGLPDCGRGRVTDRGREYASQVEDLDRSDEVQHAV